MPGVTRRTLINSSIGLVAAGAFGRPYIADAQAKTAEVWWVQGFLPEAFSRIDESFAKYQIKA